MIFFMIFFFFLLGSLENSNGMWSQTVQSRAKVKDAKPLQVYLQQRQATLAQVLSSCRSVVSPKSNLCHVLSLLMPSSKCYQDEDRFREEEVK